MQVLLDELVFERVTGEFCVAPHLHFLHDSGAIGADCLNTHMELVAD